MDVRNTKYPDNLLRELGITEVTEKRKSDLEKALSMLDENSRNLLKMRYEQRMKYTQMKNVLNCSSQVARSKTEKALIKFMSRDYRKYIC